MQPNNSPKTMRSNTCVAFNRFFNQILSSAFVHHRFIFVNPFRNSMVIPIIQYQMISSRWFFVRCWRQHQKMFRIFSKWRYKIRKLFFGLKFPIYFMYRQICDRQKPNVSAGKRTPRTANNFRLLRFSIYIGSTEKLVKDRKFFANTEQYRKRCVLERM